MNFEISVTNPLVFNGNGLKSIMKLRSLNFLHQQNHQIFNKTFKKEIPKISLLNVSIPPHLTRIKMNRSMPL